MAVVLYSSRSSSTLIFHLEHSLCVFDRSVLFCARSVSQRERILGGRRSRSGDSGQQNFPVKLIVEVIRDDVLDSHGFTLSSQHPLLVRDVTPGTHTHTHTLHVEFGLQDMQEQVVFKHRLWSKLSRVWILPWPYVRNCAQRTIWDPVKIP